MTLGPVRVMGAGVVATVHVEEVRNLASNDILPMDIVAKLQNKV